MENDSKKKLLLVGAGQQCAFLCKTLSEIHTDNIVVCDNDASKWGQTVYGYVIEKPPCWDDDLYCGYYITVRNPRYAQDIRNQISHDYYFNKSQELSECGMMVEAYLRSDKCKRTLTSSEEKEKSVIFVSQSGLGLGGVEAWTRQIAGELLKHGYNCKIITTRGNYSLPSNLESRVIYEDFSIWSFYDYDKVFRLIVQILSMIPCTVVCDHINESMLAAIILKTMYPNFVKVVSVIHGGVENTINENVKLSRYIDRYIGVSKYITSKLQDKGIPNAKISYMTVPLDGKEKLIRRYNVEDSTPIKIGYAGRMDGMQNSQKRMDIMLNLILEIERLGIDYVFDLAGDGDARAEMESVITRKNLNKKVHFWGEIKRNDINLFWENHDICVNTADYEGRSISILEAMICGTVPVVTDVSGVSDDITDYENGFIVPTGDFTLMADRINLLSKNRQQIPQMGARAHETVYRKSRMNEHIKFWKEII